MGTVTECFANLTEYLLAERKKTKRRGAESDLILSHLIKPFMPAAIRCGSGTVTDIKDRQVGPFDVVAALDTFPPLSDGSAATFLADGVLFALQARNWAEQDLSHFGDIAHQLKQLDRTNKTRPPCFAVSFDLLPLGELAQFLKSKAGQSIDGILSVGHHVILRNSQGWYGDPSHVPFVTERPGPEALKAFTFFLLHLSHTALGLPFGLADYQHL